MVAREARVSLNEVVWYWLNYEYQGRDNFREHIDRNYSHADVRNLILSEPDYADTVANRRRFEMLKSYRYFIDWFDHAEWWRAKLNERDVSELLVIAAPHWERLSNGTLRALDIARTIDARSEELLGDRESAGRVRKILNNMAEKAKRPSRLVVVATKGSPHLTVIDGVHRAIRMNLYYFVRREGAFEEAYAYLGLTPDPLDYTSFARFEDEDYAELRAIGTP